MANEAILVDGDLAGRILVLPDALPSKLELVVRDPVTDEQLAVLIYTDSYGNDVNGRRIYQLNLTP